MSGPEEDNMYQDSQITEPDKAVNSQEDLFENDDIDADAIASSAKHACLHVCKENNVLLKEILKELKELKSVRSQDSRSSLTSAFCVEKSVLEKPIVEFLKARFPQEPFLGDPDVELRNKVNHLHKRHHIPEEKCVVWKAALKFSCRKMVDFRAQTKAKLMGDNCGELSIADLSKLIFSKFGSWTEEEAIHTTILLRSFCHEKRLLKKFNESIKDFWMNFKLYRLDILKDSEEDKWGKLRRREDKRIDRYSKI